MIKQIVVSINHRLLLFIILKFSGKSFKVVHKPNSSLRISKYIKIFCSFIVFPVCKFLSSHIFSFAKSQFILCLVAKMFICPKKFSFMYQQQQKNRDMKGFFMSQNWGISPDWKVIDVEWEWRIFYRRAWNAAWNVVWAFRIIINSCSALTLSYSTICRIDFGHDHGYSCAVCA